MVKKEVLRELNRNELISLLQKFVPQIQDEEIPRKRYVDSIPICVFNNETLSSLETICKYLKENCKYTYHEIALILNRNDRTIWTTYNNSKKKLAEKFVIKPSEISLPLDIFKERKLSVLESIAVYLKDKVGLSLHEIAKLLNRNDRTIWTVYNRGKKKNA